MRRCLIPLAAVLAAAAPSSAPAASSSFRTPTGNVHCTYVSDSLTYLRCDMTRVDATPPHPGWCDFDYGKYFGLTARGSGRRLCVSDTVTNPDARVLAYGSTWKRGGYTCRSRRVHLRCTNARGHGFELSRARQKLF